MNAQPPGLGEYLSPGPVQTRLLHKMAAGHAYQRHGAELGLTRPAHRTEVRKHLSSAQLGFEVTGRDGRPRYLVSDPGTNRLAWVNPHAEHRSTFFSPRDDVITYMRRTQVQKPLDRWRTIDLRAERTRGQASHRIMSTSRGAADRPGPER